MMLSEVWSSALSIHRRAAHLHQGGFVMGVIVLIVLILLLFGSIPTWPHSRSWGYRPSGVLSVVLVVVLVLVLTGRL
jgi:multisubunit Na+/H+ antiporter MnhB subunit